MIRRFLIISLALSALSGCDHGKSKHQNTTTLSTALQYANGFTVRYSGKQKWVDVTYPYAGATEGYHYLLVQKNEPVPPHDPGTTVITVPLESIVCTSTTHIPLLDYLGETERLVGFPTTDYISSEKMRTRIDAGKVKDLGMDQGMNYELLVSLRPSMVMSYSTGKDPGQIRKINGLGIPVVINAEYLEKHPLGRAEWIKFMALFFNKEKEADSVFQIIEKAYLQTQKLISEKISRPTVLSGIVYGDTWYLPGGQNYSARLLEDAGCRYLWRDDPSTGSLELSFESVYARAKDADLWVGVGSFKSLAEIKAAEERYTGFKPFRTGKVFSYNTRKGAKGGSEFLELGYLRPDLILRDLVKIAHPELLPDHAFYFFGQLK